MMPQLQRTAALLGMDREPASPAEQLVSALGGFLSILCIWWVSARHLDAGGAALLVASMGASAVLLFAVPHGPLSQPWPLLAGHTVSAVLGIACATWVDPPMLAAPLAVGLAIGAMHLLRCIHPPGGATALTAVIGGPGVQALGWEFLLTPVLLNVLVIGLVGVLFNFPFRWRRYPAALSRNRPRQEEKPRSALFSHADLVYALGRLDTFVDVSEQDLLQIYAIANQHREESALEATAIQAHRFYSNGRYGPEWQVRQVLEISAPDNDGRQVVNYRVAAGHRRRQTAKCGLLEFARWARYEVVLNENSWQRVNEWSPQNG
jgi:CBS-domain-containing membrane protein